MAKNGHHSIRMNTSAPKPSRNQQGQLSIFLGVSITIILALLAFIVNVGLFVKAKINLQNAVDSAAWSGAAVQARQLTQIGYLNWEIRNTYKEWLFKYYVLGQLGNENINSSTISGTGSMSFKLGEFDAAETDKFNVPSICIHYGSSKNICSIYDVPGLPRFESMGDPAIGKQMKEFVTAITETKSQACVERSNLNQVTAINWSYGTGDEDAFSGLPMILSNRPGVWPQALDVAFRIRNLEAIVNRPPVSNICSGGSGCTSVSSLNTHSYDNHPVNARPIKAFMSAYRNLSGGSIKGDPNSDTFSSTFKLTELSPTPKTFEPNSLSGMLIPTSETIEGSLAREKHYLDLKVNPVNYVTFYTSFLVDEGTDSTTGTAAEGQCLTTRTALPVPALVTGFSKNPEIMTYYAVKGEANFVGLFYPFFSESNGINLKAYASAKPFGGRIGPQFFKYDGNGQALMPRTDVKYRTAPNIYGMELNPADVGPGYMLPVNPDFWVFNESHRIGGNPKGGSDVRFGIPNMVYDFEGTADLQQATESSTTDPVQALKDTSSSSSTNENYGLYSKPQFRMLASNLYDFDDPGTGGSLTGNSLEQAVDRARAPTRYDALNYLIPTPQSSKNLDTEPVIHTTTASGTGGNNRSMYRLYAPIRGLLYKDVNTLTNNAFRLMRQSSSAIDLYLESLKDAAETIYTKGQANTGSTGTTYEDAIAKIYPTDSPGDFVPVDTLRARAQNSPFDCSSMAGKFAFFFNDEPKEGACPNVKALFFLLRDYFSNISNEEATNLYYRAPYPSSLPSNSTANDFSDFHSAYAPGPITGASDEGEVTSPLTGQSFGLSQRNFYSTKFIPLQKVIQGGNHSFAGDNNPTPLYREQPTLGGNPLGFSENFSNEIRASDLAGFGDIDNLTH